MPRIAQFVVLSPHPLLCVPGLCSPNSLFDLVCYCSSFPIFCCPFIFPSVFFLISWLKPRAWLFEDYRKEQHWEIKVSVQRPGEQFTKRVIRKHFNTTVKTSFDSNRSLSKYLYICRIIFIYISLNKAIPMYIFINLDIDI